MRIIHGLIQGTPEWHLHRAGTRNASDAPAMMGTSPYVSRSELVRQYATGAEREIDAATQRVFDKGHEVEPTLRELAESIIGEELYPVTATGNDGYLGASLDGVTMDESIIFEAKQYNASKVNHIRLAGTIPPPDHWQVVQQFAVCEAAERCLYLCGDGTKNGTAVLWVNRSAVAGDIANLRAGWEQFDADVVAYAPMAAKVKAVAAPVEGFGALSLRVEGRVLASNLDAFKAGADAFIARLPKPEDLQTDQDFVDAGAAVKACAEAESRIKSAKDAAIAQMSDVETVLRTADSIHDAIRVARLALERATSAEKENRRNAIVDGGRQAAQTHYDEINASLPPKYVMAFPRNEVHSRMSAAIKGKRTLSSLNDAVATEVAAIKIAASQQAEKLRQNIVILDAIAPEYAGLFADAAALAHGKQVDDLRNLVAARITAAESARAARDAEAEAAKERLPADGGAKKIVQEQATPAPTPITATNPPHPSAAQDDADILRGIINRYPLSSQERAALGRAIEVITYKEAA